ncbi:MAG: fumarylacetoacetate hydrolase [Armatimonadetes bacterium]|nr:fumarylacetoacetate hydrolase [Armatimonadota bacterium]MBS1726512.1 fumarylacetoacetate hydrolase family protein [Armatimonadota bacterium]
MLLTRHASREGIVWCVDGHALPTETTLIDLLQMDAKEMNSLLLESPHERTQDRVAPIEPHQEVWASGVTYLRSRVEREAESSSSDVYSTVYTAERPELFFKSVGWRVVGDGDPIRIRKDSEWNVPEPELTLVINAKGQIIGYTIGNDVSSRSIEGENPLYLPQAKMYDGSCALGPGIVVASAKDIEFLPIEMEIWRGDECIFEDRTDLSQMKRELNELVSFLFREMSFPDGVFLMTGTGIVPAAPFTLEVGDHVIIRIGELTLANKVG